jgi:hypothetical protein
VRRRTTLFTYFLLALTVALIVRVPVLNSPNSTLQELPTDGENPQLHDCGIFVLRKMHDFCCEEDVITIESEAYGRLGNRIITLRKVLRVAAISGCHVRLQSRFLRGWDPGWNFFENQATNSTARTGACIQRSNKDWYNYNEFRQTTMPSERIGCAIDRAVSTYFATNSSHVFGQKCSSNDYLAVHIRSGDTMKGIFNASTGDFKPTGFHRLYGPFPTAFYAHVIKEVALDKRVVVCCEDTDNPACEFLLKVGIIAQNIEIRIRQPLIADLQVLNCANDIALSYGTFREAVLLRKESRVVHDFSETTTEHEACGADYDAIMYHIKDHDKRNAYLQHVRHDNWMNTAHQRFVVDTMYEMGTRRCSRSTGFHYKIPAWSS